MNWFYLIIAALFEVGWPLGFKLSQTTGNKFLWIAVATFSMTLSGVFLWLAQRSIPIGVAYAVWTGIGAAGAFIVGIILFGDAVSIGRIAGIGLILAGVATLKLST